MNEDGKTEVKEFRPGRGFWVVRVSALILSFGLIFWGVALQNELTRREGFYPEGYIFGFLAMVGVVVFVIPYFIIGLSSLYYCLKEDLLEVENRSFSKSPTQILYGNITVISASQGLYERSRGLGTVIIRIKNSRWRIKLHCIREYQTVAEEILRHVRQAGGQAQEVIKTSIVRPLFFWLIPVLVLAAVIFISLDLDEARTRESGSRSVTRHGLMKLRMYRELTYSGFLLRNWHFKAVVDFKPRKSSGISGGRSGTGLQPELLKEPDKKSGYARIAAVRYDGITELLPGNVWIPAENMGIFWVGRIYGVSTDGGKTWKIWNAEKDLPGFDPEKYGYIREVEFDTDEEGKGYMDLPPVRLHTEDFGQTWQPGEDK